MRVELVHPWATRAGFGRRMDLLAEGLASRHDVRRRRRLADLPGLLVPGGPPRVILVYTCLLAPLVLALRLMRRRDAIRYMVRGDEILEARRQGRRLRAGLAAVLQGLLARLDVRWVFASGDLEDLFLSRHPGLRERRVLPNTLGRPLPPSRPFDGRVGLVGDFGSVKEVEWLLAELRGGGWDLHLFGNGALPAEMASPDLTSHGQVRDLTAQLARHCSLVALASSSEGFPNVALDALEAGCALAMPADFPFARFPLSAGWRFCRAPGALQALLEEIRRRQADFTAENGPLRELAERDWIRLAEEALA